MPKRLLTAVLVFVLMVSSACRAAIRSPEATQPPLEDAPVISPETNAPPELPTGEAQVKAETPTSEAEIGSGTPTAEIEATQTESAHPTAQPAPGGAAPAPLPAGPVTLISLGDSLTEGSGDSDAGVGYPVRLLNKIQALRPGSTLHNLGRSGWVSDDLINGNQDGPSQLQEAIQLLAEANISGKPALATVWIGSNDLWFLYEYGPEPMTAEAEASDLEHFRANMLIIVSTLRLSGAEVLLALLDDQSKRPVVANPPNPSEPAFPATTADDRQRMAKHVQEYNAILTEVAGQFGAGLVDFYHTTLFTQAATLDSDGNHPNPAGYDLIADIWFRAAQPLLP